ncbi:MAG TPA: hypothetical protein VMZ53_06680 [Kofleriaceae bacterium]|nr:hypothetical protein [Kofleriaceae bacterium]
MSRAVALALALAVATSGCATYEGSRNTAVASGVSFAVGMGTWIGGSQADSAPTAVAGLALGTASMMVVMASAVGMAILPKRVEIALRLAHELVVRAEAGDCETVTLRRAEVEELDALVYEVVLMEDPAIVECFGSSPSSSSPSSSPSAPAVVPVRLDPASTSTVR